MDVIFIGQSSNLLQNANMLTFTKEAIKTFAISSKSSEEKISGKRVWRNEGFFKDAKLELNLEKKIFLRTAFYILVNPTFLLLKTATWQCVIIT